MKIRHNRLILLILITGMVLGCSLNSRYIADITFFNPIFTALFRAGPVLVLTGMFFLFRRYQQLERALDDSKRQNRTMEQKVEEQKARLANQTRALELEIHERQKDRQHLEQSRERFRLAMEASRDAVWDWDIESGRIYFSPGYARMLGFSPEEFPADIKTWQQRIHPEDKEQTLAANQACIDNLCEDFVVEYRMRDKSGNWRWILGRGKAVERQENGRALRLIGTHTDISRLKQSEAEKLRLQALADEQKKMALVGQVAGKMAHDFNNTLGIILSNAEFTLMDCKEPETRNTLKLIVDQTVKGKNLTKNLAAFAKDQEPKPLFFDLNKKIELVLGLMEKDLEFITVTRKFDRDLPKLLADPAMIEHALLNLLQNAVHALGKTLHPHITLGTGTADRHILLEIKDNGCGIPKQYLERVFEPAFTLKGSKDTANAYDTFIKGTGYGLSNVKKYVTQHRGQVRIDSGPGLGTTLSIALPLVHKALTEKDISKLETTRMFREKRILLVEDEAAIAQIQSRILAQPPCSHHVDIARNAQAAMDLFDRDPDGYDLASIDFVLPHNMNGMDVYHHIRQKRPGIPVLFISGNIEFLESVESLEAKDPFLGHISKPCQNLAYIERINRLLARALPGGRQEKQMTSPGV